MNDTTVRTIGVLAFICFVMLVGAFWDGCNRADREYTKRTALRTQTTQPVWETTEGFRP